MKLISSKTHGCLDYITGAILITFPFIAGWDAEAFPSRILHVLGVTTIVYSMVTKYEISFAKWIPFKVHLGIDLLSGIFLAASPWLFGFDDIVYLPHLLFGIFEIAVVSMTSRKLATGTVLPYGSY